MPRKTDDYDDLLPTVASDFRQFEVLQRERDTAVAQVCERDDKIRELENEIYRDRAFWLLPGGIVFAVGAIVLTIVFLALTFAGGGPEARRAHAEAKLGLFPAVCARAGGQATAGEFNYRWCVLPQGSLRESTQRSGASRDDWIEACQANGATVTGTRENSDQFCVFPNGTILKT